MVKFAMQEAKRLRLQVGDACKRWICIRWRTLDHAELSMQKLVWTKTYMKDGLNGKINVEKPETNEGIL